LFFDAALQDNNEAQSYTTPLGKPLISRESRQAGEHCIPNRVGIEERPAIIEEKLRIGDWEGDTVISHRSRCALVTIVERHSKYLKMRKIGRKSMENTSNAI
jgi:IS30 family transposase